MAVLAVVVSLTWESVPGGFTVALTLYFAVGGGLLVWGRQKR